jgi:hypothetical protein
VRLEELDANVYALDHIEKVRLEDERLARVVEQMRRVF